MPWIRSREPGLHGNPYDASAVRGRPPQGPFASDGPDHVEYT